VRVLGFKEAEPLPSARIEEVIVPAASGTEVEALAIEARRLARDILALLPGVPAQVGQALDGIADPGALSDLLTHHVPADSSAKQKVLETIDPVERLRLVVDLLARRREVLKTAHDIEGAVQAKVSNVAVLSRWPSVTVSADAATVTAASTWPARQAPNWSSTTTTCPAPPASSPAAAASTWPTTAWAPRRSTRP